MLWCVHGRYNQTVFSLWLFSRWLLKDVCRDVAFGQHCIEAQCLALSLLREPHVSLVKLSAFGRFDAVLRVCVTLTE